MPDVAAAPSTEKAHAGPDEWQPQIVSICCVDIAGGKTYGALVKGIGPPATSESQVRFPAVVLLYVTTFGRWFVQVDHT